MNKYFEIKNNYDKIYENVKISAQKCGRNFDDITILAVSKTHPIDAIIKANEYGMQEFGENYAQELKEKQDEIIKNNYPQVNWHFIGHLQTNKVKYLAPFVKMIHSVDSLKLAEEIGKQAKKYNRTIDILLQVNTSNEESKSGVEPNEVFKLAKEVQNIENVRIKGLMTIGSFSNDANISIKEFSILRNLKIELKSSFPEIDFQHLSMGMTHDYEIAVTEGSTILRIGTAIFGQRDYSK